MTPPVGGTLPDDRGRPLRLEDGPRIAAALAAQSFAPSEHRFANLWLFRDRHRYRLVEDGLPHIRGITYDSVVHALPLAEPDRRQLEELAAEGVECLYPLGSEGEALARRFGLQLTHDPADSDYWYDGAAMATLAQAKSRRGQARSFASEASPKWVDWEPGLAAMADAVLDGWAADVARPDDRTDVVECREAIVLAAPLGLEGGFACMGTGEPVAFLLASRDGDTRVIHFAKGRRTHSHAYPWLFSTYAGRSAARWLNFEQDLGNPGLARSKRAYGPARVEPKFRMGLAELR